MTKTIQQWLDERRMPALWFDTVAAARSKSRLGGLPSLPEGVDWPVHHDTRRPLHFMFQVDLSALPPTPLPGCPFSAMLPREGMLFFFFNYAEYWEEEFDARGKDGLLKQARVIYGETAGADRAAPDALPMIGYNPETLECRWERQETSLPEQPLRAYVIDSFWGESEIVDGKSVRPFVRTESGGAEDEAAKFESLVKATGEPPVVYPEWEAVPYPPPSYYTYEQTNDNFGEIETSRINRMAGLQMFGADGFNGGYRPNQDRGALLAELPLEDGSLQFWMKAADLKAGRFDRVRLAPENS
jgi:hypothetical protein